MQQLQVLEQGQQLVLEILLEQVLLACRPLVEELAQQLALALEQLGMQQGLLESLQPLELGLQHLQPLPALGLPVLSLRLGQRALLFCFWRCQYPRPAQ